MNRFLGVLLFSLVTANASGDTKTADDIVCSLAPSQSSLVAGAAGALGGAGATIAGIAQAAGLTLVAHSSGGMILTGSSGYIAGTLGGTALAGPAIIGVALVVAGTAITVELLCVPKNHPREVEKVEMAAKEFVKRSRLSFAGAKANAVQAGQNAAASVKQITGDAFEYAFRR